MKQVAIGLLALSVSSVTLAGFSIEGSPVVSTERGAMTGYVPYQENAAARFKQSDSTNTPRQNRYQDADLMLDLAYKSVVQRGSGPADRVDGFADDVPFNMAMRMILPSGWQLYRDKNLSEKEVPERIGFVGDKPWTDVLAQIGDRYALQFAVDWYDRTILLKKGRGTPVNERAKIRVIAEPAPLPPIKPMALMPESKAGAKTFAAADAKPLLAKSDLPVPIVKGAGAKPSAPAAGASNAIAAKTSPAPVVTPAPAIPRQFSMNVQAGTLHDNVVRISKEQGWNAPEWAIDGDYRIPATYSIQAANFPDAMVKLLMLHPIEADVNTAQRKIFVLREVR